MYHDAAKAGVFEGHRVELLEGDTADYQADTVWSTDTIQITAFQEVSLSAVERNIGGLTQNCASRDCVN